jgi:integrase
MSARFSSLIQEPDGGAARFSSNVARLGAGERASRERLLALDSGARKNELCGLHWGDLDFNRGTVAFARQLTKPVRRPEFGPDKNGAPRTVDFARGTVELLKAHKRSQSDYQALLLASTPAFELTLSRNRIVR